MGYDNFGFREIDVLIVVGQANPWTIDDFELENSSGIILLEDNVSILQQEE
jgi:hypothetical protein